LSVVLVFCFVMHMSHVVLPDVGSGAYYALDSIFYFGTIYVVGLYIWFASPLIIFSSLFPYLSPPLLIFSFERIDPLRLQAECRKRQLNLAVVFVFILCCITFLLIGECVLLLC